MQILTENQIALELVKRLNKPALLLSNLSPYAEDAGDCLFTASDGSLRLLAAPFIDFGYAIGNNFALIICDHEEEMVDLYDLTYGDDGLNRQAREKHNYPMYEGEHRVYALTINRDGSFGTENT